MNKEGGEMSETPRTNKFCCEPTLKQGVTEIAAEWAEFARQLELELAAVTAERDELLD